MVLSCLKFYRITTNLVKILNCTKDLPTRNVVRNLCKLFGAMLQIYYSILWEIKTGHMRNQDWTVCTFLMNNSGNYWIVSCFSRYIFIFHKVVTHELQRIATIKTIIRSEFQWIWNFWGILLQIIWVYLLENYWTVSFDIKRGNKKSHDSVLENKLSVTFLVIDNSLPLVLWHSNTYKKYFPKRSALEPVGDYHSRLANKPVA